MHRVRISGYPPTSVDPQIATVHPAQFTQLIHKRCELRLGFRITHQHADPPHPLGLLRARHERPRGRAAEQRDERATLHSITSSARASSVGGISRPSAFATIRLTTRSNLVGCSTGMSAGLVPRKILSTKSPPRLNWSRKLGPQDIRPPASTSSRPDHVVGSRAPSARMLIRSRLASTSPSLAR